MCSEKVLTTVNYAHLTMNTVLFASKTEQKNNEQGPIPSINSNRNPNYN